MHWHHAVKLGFDLGDHRCRASRDNRKARNVFFVFGFRYGKGVNVITTPGKQPNDAGQHAGLVLRDHG